MKKLITIVILIVALSSCYNDVEDSVKNPKLETTIQLQDLPKDTVVISIDKNTLYVFDENNLVKYKTVALGDDALPINFFTLALILVILFFFILIIAGRNQ